MYDNDTKTQFIMLRSYGWSINRISQELHISRPTLIKWNEDYSCLIRSLRAAELEELHESILENHQAEIARLSKQQKAIAKELAKRKLSKISTEKLYSLDALLRAEIQKIRATDAPITKHFGYIPSPDHPLVRSGLVGTPGFPEKVEPVPPAFSSEPKNRTQKRKPASPTSSQPNPPQTAETSARAVHKDKTEMNGARAHLPNPNPNSSDSVDCSDASPQIPGDPAMPDAAPAPVNL